MAKTFYEFIRDVDEALDKVSANQKYIENGNTKEAIVELRLAIDSLRSAVVLGIPRSGGL